MEAGGDILRFSGTAILTKQPVLVGLTIAFVLGLLSTQFDFSAPSPGILSKLVALTLLTVICAVTAWLLCSWEQVEIDFASRQVTERRLFLKYEIAKNQWGFSHFTGVRVEQKNSKEYSNETTPGTGGYKGTIK